MYSTFTYACLCHNAYSLMSFVPWASVLFVYFISMRKRLHVHVSDNWFVVDRCSECFNLVTNELIDYHSQFCVRPTTIWTTTLVVVSDQWLEGLNCPSAAHSVTDEWHIPLNRQIRVLWFCHKTTPHSTYSYYMYRYVYMYNIIMPSYMYRFLNNYSSCILQIINLLIADPCTVHLLLLYANMHVHVIQYV